MRGNTKSSAAVETAKMLNLRSEGPAEITLSTGDKAILKPVTASLIDAVTSRIEDPKPPMWYNESKGTEEPNPSHPDYLQAIDDANRRRGIAAMDAMVMFGVELVDGLPESEKWLDTLKYMEKRGMLSLEGYDLKDPLDLEFLYKRFVAVDTNIIAKVSELSGISSAEVERAEASFQSD